MEKERKNETYYMVIKGSKEVNFDELHLLHFTNNEICFRSRFEVPKNSIKYNPKLEKALNDFIKDIVTYGK